jgi:hypothetical protein
MAYFLFFTKLAKPSKPFSYTESRQPAPFRRRGGCRATSKQSFASFVGFVTD